MRSQGGESRPEREAEKTVDFHEERCYHLHEEVCAYDFQLESKQHKNPSDRRILKGRQMGEKKRILSAAFSLRVSIVSWMGREEDIREVEIHPHEGNEKRGDRRRRIRGEVQTRLQESHGEEILQRLHSELRQRTLDISRGDRRDKRDGHHLCVQKISVQSLMH